MRWSLAEFAVISSTYRTFSHSGSEVSRLFHFSRRSAGAVFTLSNVLLAEQATESERTNERTTDRVSE